MHSKKILPTTKTANVILVYQYIRNAANKDMSRVISLITSLTQLTCIRFKDFVLPIGKPIEEVEPLDSWQWQRTPAEEVPQ